MRFWLKIAVAVVAGFGGGFASGFFVHKKINDLKFEEVTEEEMAVLEAAEKEKQKAKQDISAPVEKLDKVEVLKEMTLPENPDELKKTLQGKVSYIRADAEQKRAYEKMWNTVKTYSDEDNADRIPVPFDTGEDKANGALRDDIPEEDDMAEDEDEELERLEKEAAEEEARHAYPAPYPVTLSDFYNDRPEYDKITIDWYEPDDVWLDEREEIIPDIRSYVGIDVRGLFAKNNPDDDPDVRFIRNERYQSDYEAIRHHRSWAETSRGG